MLQLTPHPPISTQRGITLLESLIAIVVAALGILGILGVQMRTLTDTHTSMRRTQAIRLIEDLSERMKANPNALSSINTYVMGWSSSTPTPQASSVCTNGTSCSQTALASYDIREWKRLVERTLPLGNAATFLALSDSANPSNQRQLGVLIRWRENERADFENNAAQKAYRDAINAGVSMNSDGTVSTNSDGTLGTADPTQCTAGFTCHLQYITVSARCAPDFRNGASSPLFFCPGS